MWVLPEVGLPGVTVRTGRHHASTVCPLPVQADVELVLSEGGGTDLAATATMQYQVRADKVPQGL